MEVIKAIIWFAMALIVLYLCTGIFVAWRSHSNYGKIKYNRTTYSLIMIFGIILIILDMIMTIKYTAVIVCGL